MMVKAIDSLLQNSIKMMTKAIDSLLQNSIKMMVKAIDSLLQNSIKMKNKPKLSHCRNSSNSKIVENVKIDNPNTQIHDRSLSWLGGVKLVLRSHSLYFMRKKNNKL